jgi:hypothetical protein
MYKAQPITRCVSLHVMTPETAAGAKTRSKRAAAWWTGDAYTKPRLEKTEGFSIIGRMGKLKGPRLE